jgi:DNA topoisomerase VI subunit A
MNRSEIDKVGEPSEPVRRMLERLNEEAGNPAGVDEDKDPSDTR